MARKSKHSFLAILSDIHANIDALEAVLADLAEWPCRGILCLGDIVGYGAEPAACVERIMDLSSVTVMGNHDAMFSLLEKFPASEFGPTVGDPLALAARQLTTEQREWLVELPLLADLDPITLSHASLYDPTSFHYTDSPAEASAHFSSLTTPVSFQGHTHVPVIWQDQGGDIACYPSSDKAIELDENARYAINVGSVGQPRDEDPRACYVLYDFEQRLLIHRRVPYNIERAQTRIEKAGLPTRNAKRLALGR